MSTEILNQFYYYPSTLNKISTSITKTLDKSVSTKVKYEESHEGINVHI